jgi:hypothetical protein
LRAMGVRDKPIAPASPWQNGFCRTADRIDPPRVPGSHRGFRRGSSTRNLAILRALLQRPQNASIIG